MIVVNGDPNPQAKMTDYESSPTQGQNYTVTVEGVFAFVQEQIAAYEAAGAEVSYRRNGAVARIAARFTGVQGATEVPSYRLSLKTLPVVQSLLLHPRYASLPAAVKKAVNDQIQSGAKYSDATGEITQATIDFGGSQGLALELFDWMLDGFTSFEICARTIERVMTVSSNYDTAVSQGDVEKIFSATQLATALGSRAPFEVPAVAITAAETARGLVVGWQKTMCDVTWNAAGQKEVTEHWALAKWSSQHYTLKAG